MISILHQTKPIAIGCDHAGLDFKNTIISFLKENNCTVIDCGCYDSNSVDYPDIAVETCKHVTSGEANTAILICGTGIGVSIAANKIKGIRAALCHDSFSAKFTRLHNDSNVICFGARVIGVGLAIELLDVFLSTDFEGGRHSSRVDKIMKLDIKN